MVEILAVLMTRSLAMNSIPELLLRGADAAGAIGSTDDVPPLAYRELRELMESTVARLNSFGIGRGDRVAIVLRNGPEMATSFVCVAAGATTAPLNPGYRAQELEFYLADLKAKALIVEPGPSPAREAAQKLGVALIELHSQRELGAGSFTLESALSGKPARRGLAEADDIGLLLHTSGTTSSRPKLVPLLQRNLAASARNIVESLDLQPGDLCLNIMPLFHIHGLMAATLASLAAGAHVCCTPGFNMLRYFTWLEEVKPTWTTAVPTMHQAILDRAPRHRGIVSQNRLRLIRSSSASLPARVMIELEEAFDAPVIEAYGMTEAAHQMASNPLPPRERKPGSVGVPAGPEIAILGEGGTFLRKGETGEVLIRGSSVTPGYENNPDANQASFIDGWFRTGDQGLLDEDGYLHLTGRLKELINRGGEKFSPLEIDQVLMNHPAVLQVVAFALPHEKLGEEPAAAVVLREGHTATERELHDFVHARLPAFKVPRKIVIVQEIPKGPTGKLQRIGLAKRLGLAE
jgi:acyl-CoA synthetase (AMP-forming)/AMP-acid ligase II